MEKEKAEKFLHHILSHQKNSDNVFDKVNTEERDQDNIEENIRESVDASSIGSN